MTMEFVPGTTRLSWIPDGAEPVDLTPMIYLGKPIVMHYVDPEEPFLTTFGMKPIVLRMKGRATPRLYRLLLGRTHPRIRRMHAAYGRRHGRRSRRG